MTTAGGGATTAAHQEGAALFKILDLQKRRDDPSSSELRPPPTHTCTFTHTHTRPQRWPPENTAISSGCRLLAPADTSAAVPEVVALLSVC